MLGGVPHTSKQAGAFPLCIPLLYYVYCNSGHSTPILHGVKVDVEMTNALGTNLYKLPTNQGAQKYHSWRR